MKKIINVFYAPHAHHLKTMIRNHRQVLKDFDCTDILYGTNLANSFQGEDQYKIIKLSDSSINLYVSILKAEADFIIFHGEFFRFFWFVLAGLFWRWDKIVWVCWGAGTSVKAGIRGYIVQLVKRIALPKLRVVVVLAESDRDSLEKKFKCKNLKKINYFDPFYQDFYERSKIRNKKSIYRIQVGNDASSANNHEWCFKLLSKSSINQTSQIICPFSYSRSDLSYMENLRNTAKYYLGERVIFIEELLTPSDFFELLLSIDALIIGSKEQRALYSIFAFFAMGKPVFLPGDGELYHALLDLGFDIIPIKKIPSLLLNEFVEMCFKINIQNQKIVLEMTSFDSIYAKWINLFETEKYF